MVVTIEKLSKGRDMYINQEVSQNTSIETMNTNTNKILVIQFSLMEVMVDIWPMSLGSVHVMYIVHLIMKEV